MITATEIKRRLAAQAESVCRHLIPHGKRVGRQWKCGDIYGAPGDSTIVELDGPRAGIWADFAGDQQDRGDLLDLWQQSRRIGFKEAFIEAKKWLNVTEPQSSVPPKKYFKPAPKNIIRLRETPDTEVEKYLVTDRKLSKTTLHSFKIGATEKRTPESGVEVVFPSYDASGGLTAVKYVGLKRTEDGKKVSSAEPGCAPVMFGWQAFEKTSRVLIITEGEIDCMTWHEWGYLCALSIPGGTSNMNWIDYEWENLEAFETIYLAFDMDDPGRKAAAIAANRLGLHRCPIVNLPFKDSNECLQNGITVEQAATFLRESKCITPIEIKNAADYREAVHRLANPPEEDEEILGLKTPIFGPRFRIRAGEMTLWSGHTSHGKSTLLSQLMIHAMIGNHKVAIGSFEVRGEIQLKKMIHCLALERRLEPGVIDTAIDWMSDKLWIYHITGIAKQDKIFELMEYSIRRHGVRQIVIDSLMKCDLSSDDYEAQRVFINRCWSFANDSNVHLHLVAHPRKDKNDDAPPEIYDVNGGQAVVGQPDNIVMVHRNKKKEKDREQNKLKDIDENTTPDTVVAVNKQRLTGEEFRVWLWFKSQCYRYTQNFGGKDPVYEEFGIIPKA